MSQSQLSPEQKSLAENLPKAVQAEALRKHQQLKKAVDRYQQHDEKLAQECPAAVIWRKGNARLLDYGVTMSEPVKTYALIIPSLINRYYILDLSERRSFVQHIAKQGIYPIVLDWDEPGDTETGFNMADYVTEILLPALDFTSRSTGGPLHLLGYCLGGVLSLAAAQLRPEHVASLSLLATPWDFHSDDVTSIPLTDAQLDKAKRAILSRPLLPATTLEWLFMMRRPFSFQQKFLKFGEMKTPSDIDNFVTMEHWIGDSIPMTSRAAADCFIHWAGDNGLELGKWQVANQTIDPKRISSPCFIAIPEHDHIVPTGCAQALADKLKSAITQYPSAGHVSMVAGRNAPTQLWKPYVSFVLSP